jgi:hypothetical protein
MAGSCRFLIFRGFKEHFRILKKWSDFARGSDKNVWRCYTLVRLQFAQMDFRKAVAKYGTEIGRTQECDNVQFWLCVLKLLSG